MENDAKQPTQPDLGRIREVANTLKKALKDYFGRVYVEVVESQEFKSDGDVMLSFSMEEFTIDKAGDPIYKKINSVEDLATVKKEIFDFYNDKVVDRYWDVYDKATAQLDDDTEKSLEIIGKTLQNRSKRLKSTLGKFKIDDGWDIDRMQNEFSVVLGNAISDIIESSLPSMENGLRATGLNIYEDTHKILDQFLEFLGIYTLKYKAGDKIEDGDYHTLEIVTSEEGKTKDKSLQETIRTVESLAYLFEDDFPVLGAKVTVWKVS